MNTQVPELFPSKDHTNAFEAIFRLPRKLFSVKATRVLVLQHVHSLQSNK